MRTQPPSALPHDPMLHGILQEGLKQERWNEAVSCVLVDLPLDAQQRAMSDLEDPYVAPQPFQFLLDANEFARA
jgi:hypothetical protein